MAIGLALVVVGAMLCWLEERSKRDEKLRGPAEFVESLAKLLEVLTNHPVGLRMITLGIVLYFVGGAVCAGFALTG